MDGKPAVLTQSEFGVVVARDDGTIVNFIQRPWATDADGVDVATRYEVSGSQITQHVDHHGHAYPVVADPRLACSGVWCTIEFTWSETLTASSTTSGASAILCAAFASFPPGALVCAAYVLAFNITATQAVNQQDCVGFRFSSIGLPPHPAIYDDAGTFCNPT